MTKAVEDLTVAVTFEEISAMLVDIGEALDAAEIVELSDQQSWMISFDNEMADTIGLDYDTRAGMLRLSGPLGSPPAERRLATYEYLLGYTMLWPETGGVHMALDGPGGDIVALYTVALADLTGDQLGTALTNFVAMMRAQQLIVTTGIADLDDADAANNADGASPGFDPRMTNSLA